MSHVMPSILLLLTTAAIGTVASAEESRMSSLVEGNSQFAVDLYGKLRNQPGNLFFSPSSISTALAMTYAGARGETAEQMARVLHLPAPQDKLPEAFRWLHAALRPVAEKPGYWLNVANRLWGQQGYHFLPDFLAEEIRNHFRTLLFDSTADLLTALIRGIAPQKPVFENSS